MSEKRLCKIYKQARATKARGPEESCQAIAPFADTRQCVSFAGKNSHVSLKYLYTHFRITLKNNDLTLRTHT